MLNYSLAQSGISSSIVNVILSGSSLTSVTFLSTSVEMNVLGTFPFHIITFYRHLYGHRAGITVFLALHLLKIESSMWPLLNFIFTGIQFDHLQC